MKKILLFALFFTASITYAQETDFDKVMAFAKVIMENDNLSEREKAYADLQNLKKHTKEPAALVALAQLDSKLEGLMKMKSLFFPAKDVDFSDKKRFKDYRIENDKFKNTTYIYAKGYYNPPDFNSYIVLHDGKIGLILETFYSGYGWLFMDQTIVLINGEKIQFKLDDVKRQLGTPRVSEKASNYVDENIMKFMRTATDPNADIDVRLQGEKLTDFKLPKNTREKFAKILSLYDEIKK